MLDVALVGLGDIGLGAHLPALLRHRDVRVAALVDPDADRQERARQLIASGQGSCQAHIAPGRDMRLTTSSDPGDLLLVSEIDSVLGTGVDAVVLATPPWVTPELTVRAVRGGCFVLAEKPVATSVTAAGVYDGLSATERDRVQVGLTYRHDPAIERLRDWVHAGRLGRPLLVRAHIYDEALDPADPEHARRIRTALRHGPPVVHEGAHVFDWLAVILETAPEAVVDAWAVRTDPDAPAPNLIGGRLAYPNGTTALVEFGWLTAAQPRTELSLLGPEGYAELDGDTFDLRLSTADQLDVVEFPGDRGERCFDRQLDRFVELALGRRRTPDPGLAEGRSALALAEDIVRRADAGREPSWS